MEFGQLRKGIWNSDTGGNFIYSNTEKGGGLWEEELTYFMIPSAMAFTVTSKRPPLPANVLPTMIRSKPKFP